MLNTTNASHKKYFLLILIGVSTGYFTYVLVLQGKSNSWYLDDTINDIENEEVDEKYDFDKVLKKYLDARAMGLSIDEVADKVFGVRLVQQ